MAVKKSCGLTVKLTAAMKKEICRRIAEGQSLRSICRDKDMPDKSSVLRAVGKDERFRELYAAAREIQAEGYADEIIEIADESRIGKKSKKLADGNIEVTTGDMVERSKLQVDARKWLLSKLLPKKYGDRVEVETPGLIDFAKEFMEARKRAE